MDSINLWLDPNEVRQLAEQLIRPVAKPKISVSDLGFDASFVGFVGNEPSQETTKPVSETPRIIALPLTNTSGEPAVTPVAVETVLTIPKASQPAPEVPVSEPPAPQPPIKPEVLLPVITAAAPEVTETPEVAISKEPIVTVIPPVTEPLSEPAAVEPTPIPVNKPSAFKFTKVIKTPLPVSPPATSGLAAPVIPAPAVPVTPVSAAAPPVSPAQTLPLAPIQNPSTASVSTISSAPIPTLTPTSKPVVAQPPVLPGLPVASPSPRPQPFRLATPKPAEPIAPVIGTETPSKPEPSQGSSILREWLSTQKQLVQVFIVNQNGEILYDDHSLKSLHFIAKNLAHKPGDSENIRLRLGPKEILELIPCNLEKGNIVMGAVVANPLTQEEIGNIIEKLKQIV